MRVRVIQRPNIRTINARTHAWKLARADFSVYALSSNLCVCTFNKWGPWSGLRQYLSCNLYAYKNMYSFNVYMIRSFRVYMIRSLWRVIIHTPPTPRGGYSYSAYHMHVKIFFAYKLHASKCNCINVHEIVLCGLECVAPVCRCVQMQKLSGH